MPLDSPSRTDASHELLRTEPLHVKLREWLCVTPPLNLKSCAAPPCERTVSGARRWTSIACGRASVATTRQRTFVISPSASPLSRA